MDKNDLGNQLLLENIIAYFKLFITNGVFLYNHIELLCIKLKLIEFSIKDIMETQTNNNTSNANNHFEALFSKLIGLKLIL